MRIRKKYRTCPICGSHLDHGEHCDCEECMEQDALSEAALSAAQPAMADGQEFMLMPGA